MTARHVEGGQGWTSKDRRGTTTHVIEAFLDLFPGCLFRDVEYAVVIYVAGQAGCGCSWASRRERAMGAESGDDGTRAARTLSAGGERDGDCARQPLQRRHSEHRLGGSQAGAEQECSRRWLQKEDATSIGELCQLASRWKSVRTLYDIERVQMRCMECERLLLALCSGSFTLGVSPFSLLRDFARVLHRRVHVQRP